ncbi:PR domain zinc finger protein 5-like isoform X1 [Maniola hyperantus]|uniref:PR domain zinc finger protein 5-like isoform X1 n=1 Tax=Aphantopus hyperantus TaxID=2795564 RepID=UPI00374A64D3
MNESEDNTKYGECRCCSTLGNHCDLMKEYEWNGTREVYFKIFLECFNVFLCTNTSKSNLICTSCVLRLRDATSFKKMVLEAERSLTSCEVKQEDAGTDAVDPSDNMSSIVVEIKSEQLESTETERNDEDSDNDSMPEQEEAETTKEFKDTRPSPWQIRNNNRKEKLAYIHNTTLIIENSNVTPFKPKYQNGFPCFYCSVALQDLAAMRKHQQKHTKTQLKNVLNSIGAEAFIVYVDVTDLKCTICNEEIPSLTELKSHLVKKHDKKMQDSPDRIVPFKLTPNIFECQVCKCNYETFGAMERHMNVHFRNYVCKECGTGFVTKSRFKVHSKQHDEGSFQCETCKKVYATPLKLKNHIDIVHKMVKRFKCMKCDERFTEYLKRQKHMEETHGAAKLEYKCKVCDKVFDRQIRLSAHKKRYHLKQKDYQCELCSYTCFTNFTLKLHMIKHNGERVHECSVCKKTYARKRTLHEHMRIHNNDRRYACQECGQAFVQNCSLKGHIKTHHPELQVQ